MQITSSDERGFQTIKIIIISSLLVLVAFLGIGLYFYPKFFLDLFVNSLPFVIMFIVVVSIIGKLITSFFKVITSE